MSGSYSETSNLTTNTQSVSTDTEKSEHETEDITKSKSVSFHSALSSYYSLNTISEDANEYIVIKETRQEEHDHLDNDDHDLTEKSIKKSETREIETLTDICTSDNLAEVEVFSLLDEKIPTYKLRADNIFSHSNSDWIQAPLYFDEEAISELTNEQIQTTLDYFILSGNRVSQMTKTYYDIEAVTKLLDEKEKDLELAATIGKQLLERDQQLEAKIEYLELEVEKTSEMVNQLRHDISIKDNLLKTFIESETDNYQSLDDKTTPCHVKADTDLVNEYRYKIQDLEDENELIRSKYEILEQEVIDLETKESVLTENFYREIDEANNSLLMVEEQLKEKTNLCTNQQEEIQNLFSQIFNLQQTIKTLTKDNNDLQSNYDSSVAELFDQINDLKEKYNECLKVLSRTQEELLLCKKKYQQKQRASKKIPSGHHLLNSKCGQAMDASTIVCDEDDNEDYSVSNNAAILLNDSNHRIQPTVPSNSNSLATEVFCSLAKDYRTRNLNLSHQAYQSSDFVKKVKQKITKQIPGSSIDSCLQSDSELELMLNTFNTAMPNGNNLNEQENVAHQQFSPNSNFSNQSFRLNQSQSSNIIRQFTNCPTPDSMLSTGSASIYSNLIARSNSFLLPEKLQIVKPIEGSQTLQHWQHLARPNLGCLFESRPGISLKSGNNSENDKSYLVDGNKSIKMNYDSDNEDYGVDLYEDDEEDFFINDSELYSNFDQRSDLLFGDQYDYNIESNFEAKKNTDNRVFSPNRVELLANLLKDEENKYRIEDSFRSEDTKPNNFFYDLITSLSNKYFVTNDKKNEKFGSQELSKSSSHQSFNEKSKSLEEFEEPDTPPSSPINLPNNSAPNVLYDAIKSAFVQPFSSYFQSKNANSTLLLAPTPPGTPQNELDEEYLNSDEYKQSMRSTQLSTVKNADRLNNTKESPKNFFNQIVTKLSMFSFKPKPLSAPTPPGTPQNELEEEYINSEEYKISQESTKIDVTDNSKESSKNFFDQIVNKLSLFSFKSVPASISSNPSSYDLSKPDQNNHNPSFIFKPQPIYVKSTTPVTSSAEISKTKNEIILTNLIREDESRNYFKFINQENFIHDANKEEDDIESELVFTELNKKCETPPPSPSKFSPPLPQEEAYDEEDFKKSAFVKVASLNPLINKTIDLNSLLGSLSSLKRNQRACKYY